MAPVPPLHAICVAAEETLIAFGSSSITAELVVVHPLASVITTEYVPASNELISSCVEAYEPGPVQAYDNGATPPVVVRLIDARPPAQEICAADALAVSVFAIKLTVEDAAAVHPLLPVAVTV